MILLTEVFSVVVAQSWRIGFLIFAWAAMRLALRSRIPQKILFIGWIVIALGLLIPVSLPVAWSPFNFARPTRWVPAADFSADELPMLSRSRTAAAEPVAPAASSGHRAMDSWTPKTVLALIWLAGIGGLLAVRLLAWAGFYRRLRRLPAQASSQISAMVAECAEILHITRPISVRMTDAAGGPALGGLWKPVVIVPVHLGEELTTDELRLVILHELGHWRRGDMPANLLIQGVLVLHWFNPLVWFAVWMARADCELACDEFVMRRISASKTHEYGATLLKVLAMVRGPKPASAVLGILENKQLLKRRIQMIAHYRTWTTRRALVGWIFLALLAIAAVTREMRAQPAAPPTPPTAPVPAVAPAPGAAPAAGYYVDSKARFQHGQELAKNGKYPEALAEYLWCYDDGMRRESAMGGVRNSFLLGEIAKLGKDYPPALQALRDRVANAKAWLKAHPGDFSATADFGALNRALGDDASTLAYYDQLPAGDSNRMRLGFLVFAQLLEAKRYQDAIAAVPYDRFLMTFNAELKQAQKLKQTPGNPMPGATLQTFLLQSGSKQLEALAGAGKLDDARDLIKKLLEIDQSEATRTLLRTHLERAGHAELLEKPATAPTN